MNYKDKKIEIDNDLIKFENKNRFVILIICIVIVNGGFWLWNHDPISILSRIIGTIGGFLIAYNVLFKHLYWKNEIHLLDIKQVEARIWNSEIDKLRNFWGTPQFRYHFPMGLNKKDKPEIVFVYLKKGETAIGFTPENVEAAMSSFRKNGVKIIEEIN
jgi:hypothetical protein